MSTDFRDALQELHTSIQLYTGQNPAAADVHPAELTRRLMDAMAASADALAKPEPVALTDEALANFSGWFCRNYPGPDTIIHKPEWHAPKVFRAAADALTRYGTPANTTNQVH